MQIFESTVAHILSHRYEGFIGRVGIAVMPGSGQVSHRRVVAVGSHLDDLLTKSSGYVFKAAVRKGIAANHIRRYYPKILENTIVTAKPQRPVAVTFKSDVLNNGKLADIIFCILVLRFGNHNPGERFRYIVFHIEYALCRVYMRHAVHISVVRFKITHVAGKAGGTVYQDNITNGELGYISSLQQLDKILLGYNIFGFIMKTLLKAGRFEITDLDAKVHVRTFLHGRGIKDHAGLPFAGQDDFAPMVKRL